MPNIKSAKKRMRSNVKKAQVNTLIISSMRTAVKKVEKAVKKRSSWMGSIYEKLESSKGETREFRFNIYKKL